MSELENRTSSSGAQDRAVSAQSIDQDASASEELSAFVALKHALSVETPITKQRAKFLGRLVS